MLFRTTAFAGCLLVGVAAAGAAARAEGGTTGGQTIVEPAVPSAVDSGRESMPSAFDLTGQRVLITGAAGGIGESTSRASGSLGCSTSTVADP